MGRSTGARTFRALRMSVRCGWVSAAGVARINAQPILLGWMVSVLSGLLQNQRYEKREGLEPHQSGGGWVCGAMSWPSHGRCVAPLSP